MWRAARLTVLLVVAAAAMPAAAAAATWTDPVRLSEAPRLTSDPTLAFTPDGRAIATWGVRESADVPSFGQLIDTQVAVQDLDGWRRGSLPAGIAPSLVNGGAHGELLVAGAEQVVDGRDFYAPERITAWTAALTPRGRVAAAFARQTIWKGSVGAFDGAATPGGAAAVAWTGHRGNVSGAYASTRRPGRRFTRPLLLRGAPAPQNTFQRIAAAIDPRAGAAFAWRDRNRIYTRVVRPNGHTGERVRVGKAGGSGDVVGAAIGTRGDLTVLWTRRIGTQRAIAAAYSADGRRFTRSRVLDICVAEFTCLDMRAGAGANGELVAAWSNRDGADPVIRVASLRRARGAVRELDRGTTPGNQLVQVDADAAGNAAVSWAPPFEEATRGFTVAVRSPSGAWEPPEFVPDGALSPGPAIAFDPATHSAAAVFTTDLVGEHDAPAWFTERR